MQRFEMIEGTSFKFWEVVVQGSKMTVHFGRIGTAGQRKTTEFDNSAEAQAACEKLIGEKVAKGYHETAAAPPPPASTPDDKPTGASKRRAAPAKGKRPS